MSKIADKRAAILSAALDIFAENGFHGSPTSLISEKAGVGTGTIYRYFQSKDDLIRELHLELDGKLQAAIFADYREEVPLRQRFDNLYENLLRYFIDNPRECRFLEQFYNSPYGIAKRRARKENPGEKEACFARLFDEARQRQAFKDLPEEMLVSLSIGPMLYAVRDHLAGLVAIEDRMVPLIVEACWDAVARRD
ncbi:TetR family transcriptional regulator [Desulfuromonas versatilis]|uniref:TetR family transcriptional regulator n=1 Tax=Desulfuromonas versatilis TaxID=2802975 RepID=A0ABN6E339_9BACT|nr:TetR/AcrR family transcriptional regulator [Desulfuromonas versatilis]BCR06758.1 TetR family transcriptional regulator [Desulfuromonas versatilis]